MGWYVGIDLGGTWLRVVAQAPGKGRLGTVRDRAPGSYEGLLEAVKALLPEQCSGQVTAAGCGLPGASKDGRPIFIPALPWLEGQPLAADLAEALQAPVRLGLDGQLTLLAEAQEGAAAGLASAVLVAIGTGIGGAVMTAGRIWRGQHSTAGSWGWLPAEGAKPSAGHGAFEQVASGTALSSLAASVSAGWSGLKLVEAARAGQESAVLAVKDYIAQLAPGIAAVASILDPEAVLIGGGLSAAMDLLGPLLDERVKALASPAGRKVPLRAAALGPAAGVVGALWAAQCGAEVWQ